MKQSKVLEDIKITFLNAIQFCYSFYFHFHFHDHFIVKQTKKNQKQLFCYGKP